MDKFKEKGLYWPLAVIVLLLSSVASMATFVIASQSDGGAVVVDSYYQKAVKWDSLSIVQNRIRERGWMPQLTLNGKGGIFMLLDSDRKRLPYLTGTVSLSRPHTTEKGGTYALRPLSADSTYALEFGSLKAGLWDFTFSLTDGDENLDVTIRKDLHSDGPN